MPLSPHQTRFLDELAGYGIHFVVTHWALGTTELQASEMNLFINDPDQFAAERFNVSMTQLRVWGEFITTNQCLGSTKAFERCKNIANNGGEVRTPDLMTADNPDCYCQKHKP